MAQTNLHIVNNLIQYRLYTKGKRNKAIHKMYKLYSTDSAGYKIKTYIYSGADSSK